MSKPDDPAPTRVAAARRLLGELDRARRTRLTHPDHPELIERSIESLTSVAAIGLAPGAMDLELHVNRILIDDEVVLQARPNEDWLEGLIAAGVRYVSLDARLAAPEPLTRLLALLTQRDQRPEEAARRLWSQSIPGVEFADGGFDGDSTDHDRVAAHHRLAQLPPGSAPAPLRATIERELAMNPAVRVAEALLDRLESPIRLSRETTTEFLVTLLIGTLADFEFAAAARILDTAERCGSLEAGEFDGIVDRARQVCDEGWWQRAAEAASEQDGAALSALILQLGLVPAAADRAVAFGSPAALATILQVAAEAPSDSSLTHRLAQGLPTPIEAAVRHELQNRGVAESQ